MAAVVDAQAHVLRFGKRFSPAPEDGDVGAAEAVDGLLRVADRGQVPGTRARENLDELELALVGVLELVDHDQPEAAGVVPRNGGVVAHGLERERNEVVSRKDGLGTLELRHALLDLVRERHQSRHQGAHAREGEGHLRKGELALGLVHSLLDRLARSGHVRLGEQRGRTLGRALRRRQRQEVVHGLELRGDLLGLLVVQLQRKQAAVGATEVPHDRIDVICLCKRQALKPPRSLRGDLDHRLERTVETRCAVSPVGGADAVLRKERRHGGVVLAAAGRLAQHLVQGLGTNLVLHVSGGHGELRVESKVERVALEDAPAHAVDGADPGGVDLEGVLRHASVAKGGADALLDLLRGGVGEGDNERLREAVDVGPAPLARAGRERPGDAAREREGLARAGACLDEEGLVERGDDLLLLVVQGRKVDAAH